MWYIRCALPCVCVCVCTHQSYCMFPFHLSYLSLLHHLPQRRDQSERSEAGKENILFHRPTAPCFGTILSLSLVCWCVEHLNFTTTQTGGHSHSLSAGCQKDCSDICWYERFNTRRCYWSTGYVKRVDSVHFLPGVVEMGVGGEHGASTRDNAVCFWRPVSTCLILFEETGR